MSFLIENNERILSCLVAEKLARVIRNRLSSPFILSTKCWRVTQRDITFKGQEKLSRLCAHGFVSPYPDEGESRKENEDFTGQDGGTSRKRSLDRLAFGRRNFETGSENRRKWLDFFHGRRIRGWVERQIEFGRSFCRPARFNSRQTSRWVRGDEGECEISVDRHEKLGTRFLRLFLPMFFNDRTITK